MTDEPALRPLSYLATLNRFLHEHQQSGLARVADDTVTLQDYERGIGQSEELLGLFITYLQRHGIVFAMQSWVPSARSSTGRAADF